MLCKNGASKSNAVENILKRKNNGRIKSTAVKIWNNMLKICYNKKNMDKKEGPLAGEMMK